MNYQWIPSPNPKHHIHDMTLLLPEQLTTTDEDSPLMKIISSHMRNKTDTDVSNEVLSPPFSISPSEGFTSFSFFLFCYCYLSYIVLLRYCESFIIIIIVGLCLGEIWPSSELQFLITFSPPQAGLFESLMLCDISGVESPLRLVISALGVGPLVQFLYDTIGFSFALSFRLVFF
jgi:hypothetical protein